MTCSLLRVRCGKSVRVMVPLTIVPLGRGDALGRRGLFGLQHVVEALLEPKRGLAVRATPDVTTVRLHEPCFGVVAELKIQDLPQLRLQARLDDRKGYFNAPIEIAWHPVCGCRPKGMGFTVKEIENPRVLEVTIDYRDNPNALR